MCVLPVFGLEGVMQHLESGGLVMFSKIPTGRKHDAVVFDTLVHFSTFYKDPNTSRQFSRYES